MDQPNIEVGAEQLLLERVKVAGQTALGPQMLHDLEAKAILEAQMGQLLVQLRTYVYAERLEPIIETSTHSHPRSPWQGFKGQHWPRFLLKLFPVKEHLVTATFKVERLRVFPDNKQVFPDSLGQHVAMYQAQASYWKA